jgi:hypothetical protein
MFVAMPAAAQCMRFELLPELSVVERSVIDQFQGDEKDIFAEGEVCSGTAESFKSFVREKKITRATVHFDSPGGALYEGLALGSDIRELGFDTDISTLATELRKLGRSEVAPKLVGIGLERIAPAGHVNDAFAVEVGQVVGVARIDEALDRVVVPSNLASIAFVGNDDRASFGLHDNRHTPLPFWRERPGPAFEHCQVVCLDEPSKSFW